MTVKTNKATLESVVSDGKCLRDLTGSALMELFWSTEVTGRLFECVETEVISRLEGPNAK